jgi:hypothetical protein
MVERPMELPVIHGCALAAEGLRGQADRHRQLGRHLAALDDDARTPALRVAGPAPALEALAAALR